MISGANSTRSFSQLTQSDFDLLVIGGGIVGAGVARDAAMRGLRIALVEQNDFASGTSSRSSRLLHGGLRYLAQGHLRLVREASREKMILHQIAPHLAEPLPFVFPTYRGTQWPKWKLGIGVKLYDWLCGATNLGRSTSLSQAATIEILPNLLQNKLTGSVRYFDALTNDARLVLDTIRSAVDATAVAFNYLKFENATYRGGSWDCDLVDRHDGVELSVSAKTIVNAAGPWSDRISHSNTCLRLTKGVHLVIPRDRLSVTHAVVMSEGKRIMFAIPWGDRVILGTTDTDYEGAIDSPRCEQTDVDYVLGVTNRYFPAANLKTEDLISSWVGLRPLVYDPSRGPSDTSRNHEISSRHAGWWDITGGKLTTYRLMAQQAVDRIESFLGCGKTTCLTATEPLLRSVDLPVASGLLPPPVHQDVVEHYCLKESAVQLSDVMIRRTGWCYYLKHHKQVAVEVARWMASICNWNADRTNGQIADYYRAINEAAPWRHSDNFKLRAEE